jgi:type I restriction enzyme S subunit
MGGWVKVEFGKLGKKYSGLSNKKGEDFGFGKPYITYLNIFNNSCIDTSKFEYVNINPFEKQPKVKNGDIFFTVSSETIAEVGMSSVLLEDIEELYLNSFCFGFRLNDFNTIIPEYVRYLLRSNSIRHKISLCGKGSTRYNLSKTELLSNLTIDIPKDTYEQRKIASILSTIDNNIELTEQLIAKQKNIKTGLMHDLLSYGIDEKGQIRSLQTHNFVEKNGIVVPEEWEVMKLKDVSSMKSGIFISSDKISTFNTYPVYGGNGLRGYTDIATHNGEYVLIGRQGALCGNVTKVSTSFYATEHAVVVYLSDQMDTLWMYYKLVFMNLNQYSTASAQPGLAVSKILNLMIGIPKKNEQMKISAFLSKQDQIISEQEVKLRKLESIKKGLMEDLLTGKVRVNY